MVADASSVRVRLHPVDIVIVSPSGLLLRVGEVSRAVRCLGACCAQVDRGKYRRYM